MFTTQYLRLGGLNLKPKPIRTCSRHLKIKSAALTKVLLISSYQTIAICLFPCQNDETPPTSPQSLRSLDIITLIHQIPPTRTKGSDVLYPTQGILPVSPQLLASSWSGSNLVSPSRGLGCDVMAVWVTGAGCIWTVGPVGCAGGWAGVRAADWALAA